MGDAGVQSVEVGLVGYHGSRVTVRGRRAASLPCCGHYHLTKICLGLQQPIDHATLQDDTCSTLAKLATDALYRGDFDTAAHILATVFIQGPWVLLYVGRGKQLQVAHLSALISMWPGNNM